MEKVIFVGLDVHKESIAIGVDRADGMQPSVLATIPHDTAALIKRLKSLGPTKCLKVCCEAGPTGFGLQRDLKKAGIDCIVVAPSLVPTKAGDKVKTDKRDAVKLAKFLRGGQLDAIHVPDTETEAMRDLERARDAAKNAQKAAKQQLGGFLLRTGRRYVAGKEAWTKKHVEWVRTQKFTEEAQNRVLTDALKAVEDGTARVERLEKDIIELVEKWSLAPVVSALQAMRGIQLITAVTIVAEIGNFERFSSPRKLMGYLGLVPSEHSSGERQSRGAITRTGNKHVRRALVESSWAYRHRPSMSREIKKRNEGQADQVKAIAWKAQHRLNSRYVRMAARGKAPQKTIVAIAREMAGFIWAIARHQQKLLPKQKTQS